MVSTIATPHCDTLFQPGHSVLGGGASFQYPESHIAANRRDWVSNENREPSFKLSESDRPTTPAHIWKKSFTSSGLLYSQVETGVSTATSETRNDEDEDMQLRCDETRGQSPRSDHRETEDAQCERSVQLSTSLDNLLERRLASSRKNTRSGSTFCWDQLDEHEKTEDNDRTHDPNSSSDESGTRILFAQIFTDPACKSRKPTGVHDEELGERTSIWAQYDFEAAQSGLLEAFSEIRKSMASNFFPAPNDTEELWDQSEATDEDHDAHEESVFDMKEAPASDDDDAGVLLPEFRGESTPNTGQCSSLTHPDQGELRTRTVGGFLSQQIAACQTFMCCRAKPLPSVAGQPRCH